MNKILRLMTLFWRALKMWRSVLLLVAVFWAFTGWALYDYITLPIVYESYEKQSCVEVDDLYNQYTCDKMPTRYIHVWRQ